MEAAAVFILVFFIAAMVVCALKGKWWFALLSIFIPVFFLAAIVGSVRLAKPTSIWARKFYDEEQLERAIERFLSEEEYAEFKQRTSQPDPNVGELAPPIN